MSVEAVGLVKASLTDRNTPGSISVPGLKAGDRLIWGCLNGSTWVAPGLQFEPVVSVDDEIQQVGNISAGNQPWEIVLVR